MGPRARKRESLHCPLTRKRGSLHGPPRPLAGEG